MKLEGTERLKEECRDARGTSLLGDCLLDVRYALRTLRHSPAFAVTVISALALCIGANTAIFSVVDTALFRPLPFPEQDRLVSVTEGIPALGFPAIPFACPDYLFVAAQNRSFDSTAAYRLLSSEISGAGQPRRATGARVTASLFHVLKTEPLVGRSFTQSEDDTSRPVVVLSYGFAASVFGEPRGALGKSIYLDRKPYQVIGVMPARASFPPQGAAAYNNHPASFFIPVSWTKEQRQEVFNNFDHSLIARLRPGVTVQQATGDVMSLVRRLATSYPPEVQKFIEHTPNFSLEAQVLPFRQEITGNTKRPLLLLMGAVGVVLLIGCADVANLMFSRMVSRQHEFALRVALGAGKWRLARQTITEGLALSITGGILGACLAFWALPFLLRLAPEDLPFVQQAGLNGRVAVFVCALTLATPLFFCLAPLFNVIRAAVAQQLRNSGRTSSQGRQQRFIMSGTVVLQFGLAFVLLATAGLLIRSFRNASRSDPGFRPAHLLSIRIELPGTVYNQQAKITEFTNRLIAKLGALPGVSQTGTVSDLPMDSSANRLLAAQGRHGTERIDTIFCFGSALPALGIHALRGRLLAPEDALAKNRPAVLSESLARRLWPHADPIGHHVKFGESEKEPWMTVVGVVKDVKDQLSSSSPRFLLFTTPEDWDTWMNVLVRTSQDPLSLASAVRRQIKKLDPSLPVSKLETLDQVLDQSLAAERFRTSLLSAFAASALLLAMVGIAGLLAYHAAQRRQEFGVRLALGADRHDLLQLVLLHTLQLSAGGIALGLTVSLVVTRALSALLYETSHYDPATFLAVPAILALVALCASVLPAWRAIHTDPARALRAD